jgi:hypothetical protein
MHIQTGFCYPFAFPPVCVNEQHRQIPPVADWSSQTDFLLSYLSYETIFCPLVYHDDRSSCYGTAHSQHACDRNPSNSRHCCICVVLGTGQCGGATNLKLGNTDFRTAVLDSFAGSNFPTAVFGRQLVVHAYGIMAFRIAVWCRSDGFRLLCLDYGRHHHVNSLNCGQRTYQAITNSTTPRAL